MSQETPRSEITTGGVGWTATERKLRGTCADAKVEGLNLLARSKFDKAIKAECMYGRENAMKF